jgi:hypothetical protein
MSVKIYCPYISLDNSRNHTVKTAVRVVPTAQEISTPPHIVIVCIGGQRAPDIIKDLLCALPVNTPVTGVFALCNTTCRDNIYSMARVAARNSPGLIDVVVEGARLLTSSSALYMYSAMVIVDDTGDQGLQDTQEGILRSYYSISPFQIHTLSRATTYPYTEIVLKSAGGRIWDSVSELAHAILIPPLQLRLICASGCRITAISTSMYYLLHNSKECIVYINTATIIVIPVKLSIRVAHNYELLHNSMQYLYSASLVGITNIASDTLVVGRNGFTYCKKSCEIVQIAIEESIVTVLIRRVNAYMDALRKDKALQTCSRYKEHYSEYVYKKLQKYISNWPVYKHKSYLLSNEGENIIWDSVCKKDAERMAITTCL